MDINLFSARLKKARNSASKNQSEVAELCKTTQSAISSFEHGTATPNLEVAADIANLLGVSLDWLCGGDMQNIKTLGDAARVLASVIEMLPDAEIIQYNSSDDTFFNGPAYRVALTFEDGIMYNFLVGLQKLLQAVEEGYVDNEVYQLWLEKETAKLDQRPLEEAKQKTASGAGDAEDGHGGQEPHSAL